LSFIEKLADLVNFESVMGITAEKYFFVWIHYHTPKNVRWLIFQKKKN